MQIKLTPYGLNALQRAFAQAPDVAERELLAAMTEVTQLLEADVKGGYPRHTGLTSGSVAGDAFSTPTGVLGVVGSPSPVAVFVELGTRPHFPPLEPLLQWVADVLGKTGDAGYAAALGIQRKIGRQGTKPREQFGRALREQWPTVERIFEQAAGRIAQQLAGGAGGAASA